MQKAISKYWPVFVLPTLLAFIIGFIWPFIWGVYLSFQRFTTVSKTTFVGLQNYINVFSDETFLHAFSFTAAFTVVSTVLINVCAFAIALVLTRGIRGTNIFRTVYFMPNLIGGIVLGYIWQILLNGIDIRKYRYDDYMGIFSVVFQDFQLICQPLGANVAGSMEYDRDRARKALIDAGFADRLAAMEKDLDTMLYKNLSEDGVEVSGGEAQRIRLATQIGSGLVGVAYILDEPSIGLHPLDVQVLLRVFQALLDNGATVVVIEHDLDVIRNADYVIDMGPGGGESGGRVVATGTPEEIQGNPESITGRYL